MGMGESMETSWIRNSSLKAKSQEVFQEPSLWRRVVTETALHGAEPSSIVLPVLFLPCQVYCQAQDSSTFTF